LGRPRCRDLDDGARHANGLAAILTHELRIQFGMASLEFVEIDVARMLRRA